MSPSLTHVQLARRGGSLRCVCKTRVKAGAIPARTAQFSFLFCFQFGLCAVDRVYVYSVNACFWIAPSFRLLCMLVAEKNVKCAMLCATMTVFSSQTASGRVPKSTGAITSTLSLRWIGSGIRSWNSPYTSLRWFCNKSNPTLASFFLLHILGESWSCEH